MSLDLDYEAYRALVTVLFSVFFLGRLHCVRLRVNKKEFPLFEHNTKKKKYSLLQINKKMENLGKYEYLQT